MKNYLLWIALSLVCFQGNSQCEVDEFEDEVWHCWWQMPVYLLAEEDEMGWTYSWSPTTYLNDPASLMAIADIPPGTTITYTLTVTPPGCDPVIRGVITIKVPPTYATTSPVGPINYYYQYESPQELILTANDQRVWWFKNGSYTGVNNSSTFTVVIDNGSGTDYYAAGTNCYVNSGNPYGFGNVVTISRIACDDAGDYPVTIPTGNTCESALTSPNYVQLQASSLGAGTSYSYSLQHNPSCFSVNGSGHLTASGCSNYEQEGVYVKSSRNGAETYMFYYVGFADGCRMAIGNNTSENPKSPLIQQSKILPNPTNGPVTISSKEPIERIEIFNMLGRLLKTADANKASIVMLNTKGLPGGLYSVRVITKKGVEIHKMIVQ